MSCFPTRSCLIDAREGSCASSSNGLIIPTAVVCQFSIPTRAELWISTQELKLAASATLRDHNPGPLEYARVAWLTRGLNLSNDTGPLAPVEL